MTLPDKYIIVDGDPLNGFGFCGPFDTADDATRYAEQNTMGGRADWWIVQLGRPTPDLERYEKHWVDTAHTVDGTPRVLTFDECQQLGLDGSLRT